MNIRNLLLIVLVLIISSCHKPVPAMSQEAIDKAKKECDDQCYTYVEWKRFPNTIVDITCYTKWKLSKK